MQGWSPRDNSGNFIKATGLKLEQISSNCMSLFEIVEAIGGDVPTLARDSSSHWSKCASHCSRFFKPLVEMCKPLLEMCKGLPQRERERERERREATEAGMRRERKCERARHSIVIISNNNHGPEL